jgi:urease accessory protein
VLGNAGEPALAEKLHELEHRDAVETITLQPADVARRRLRARTNRGADCAIILSRSERLGHGAVLLLSPDRAVIVQVAKAAWLGLKPRDEAAALELGYLAGNLHWKVRFERELLWVQVEGDPAHYHARAADLLRDGRAALWDPEAHE